MPEASPIACHETLAACIDESLLGKMAEFVWSTKKQTWEGDEQTPQQPLFIIREGVGRISEEIKNDPKAIRKACK